MGSKAVFELAQISARDREDIDRQVDRILQHPLFHQSKRLPMFLRYIVETSLAQGGQGSTKERTVGVEVFGRKPDYDNNADPVVRVTATELRKKLAQYYYEDGHSDEIRIELPPGSYLPRFRRSLIQESLAADESLLFDSQSSERIAAPLEVPLHLLPKQIEIEPDQTSLVNIEQQQSQPPARRRMVFGLVCCLLLAVTALLLPRLWKQRHASLDTFWSGLMLSTDRAFVVMPVIGSDNLKDAEVQRRSVSVSPNLSLEDTDIAARIAIQIDRQGRSFHFVSSSEVGLDQLQTEPSILIGALDNAWTMRLTHELPFAFEEATDHRTGRIIDQSSGGTRSWTVDIDMPHKRIGHDYGVVARFTSRLTGQPTVVVAGISSQGTQAAGQLVTSKEFESVIPIVQGKKNFEIVIETEAVDGYGSRPVIVASRTW